MITSFTDMAAFVLPAVAAVAVCGGAFLRRQIPAVTAAVRPHATDLGTTWAGSAFGTSGVMTKRTAAALSYDDPQSRGSTG